MIKILILDDQEAYLRSLSGALRREFMVGAASTRTEAEGYMDDSVKVVLVDVRLSDQDPDNREGIDFLQWCRRRFPETPILMMSAYQDFDAAVEAVNLGADYFLTKPIDLRELRELLHEFGGRGRMPERTAAFRKGLDREEP